MHKIDLIISRLRLLLAELTAKQEQLQAMRRQFSEQQARIVNVTIHEDGSVDRALSMMLEIDGRLDHVDRSYTHLEAIRQKAQRELDSLLLTKIVEEARTQMTALRAQQLMRQTGAPAPAIATDDKGAPADDGWIAAEIHRLELVIEEASGAAAKSLTGIKSPA